MPFAKARDKELEPWRKMRLKIQEQSFAETEQLKKTILEFVLVELDSTIKQLVQEAVLEHAKSQTSTTLEPPITER